MSQPKILTYLRSSEFYLMEAQIGLMEDNKFTGIYITNNSIFHFNKGVLYKGHHPEELHEDNPIWKDIFKTYNDMTEYDFDCFIPQKITDNAIYIVSYDSSGADKFFCNRNTENPFEVTQGDFLRSEGYVITRDGLIKELETSPHFHFELMKMKRLKATCSDLNASEELNKILAKYGIKFIEDEQPNG